TFPRPLCWGLIEAGHRTPSATPAKAHFPGHCAGASLKPPPRSTSQRVYANFPGHCAGASLKLGCLVALVGLLPFIIEYFLDVSFYSGTRKQGLDAHALRRRVGAAT